ncbi:hypothetical protein HPB52_020884 [Rhipicephalus sanguineus]|uniref:Elongator complex protein 1 n=1 Tax=Rhipicephalus sanguineus TaxID=34632 RepID=A0A9D4T0I0_RHISA|nr:hypothetical protein HPB52_020884 [Rhipicephalus sanguineus]
MHEKKKIVSETKTLVDELGNDSDVVSSFVFLSEFQSLCIGKKSGDILMYDVSKCKAQAVGSVTGGILAMQWSPDYELVVVISGEDKVLLMTKEFDMISEKDLHAEEFGECVPITAGWGSKETQFHGSEGKQAAKVEEKPPEPAFWWDDKCPRVSWRGDGQYFVTSCINPTVDTVLATLFKVAVVPPPMCSFRVKTAASVNDVAFGIGQHENDFAIVLQDENSLVFVLSCPDGVVVPWLCGDATPLKLPKPCTTVAVCEVLKQPRVIALSDRFELFCDTVKICDDCTSFKIHGKFILLTTHRHTLRCLLLDFDLANLLNGGSANSLTDAPRELESGSLLVTSVPADGRVVLQLPRGNLETISPRALVLDTVCDHLDRKEYKDAFLLMKVNRIDLNLLCDHDPSAFLSSLSEFVQQVREPTDLNLFLTGLTDKDVSATMYASAYRARKRVPFVFKKNKRDEICDSLRNVLEQVDYDRYLLSILTCHAKKTDPELDEALSKIYRLKDSGNKAGITCDAALKYLFYLVDRKDMFDVALGTYNFDIVLMVAENSQKDPKEYVPFLNKLNQLEPNYRRFTIDMHLERYKKALKNISLCEAHFNECLNLIKTQRLYTTALDLFPEDSQRRKEVWEIYGDYLLEKKHYEEAGLVYWRCEKLRKASRAFEMCLNWNLLLSTAYQMKYGQDDLQALANRTIDALVLAKRYKEASEISETFIKDEEKTVRILLDAHMWDVALAKIHQFNKMELTEKIWKPSVTAELEVMLETVDSLKDTWSKHVARLMTVREHKANEDQGEGDFDDGAFSDVASVTSRTVGGSVTGGSSISGSIATMRTSRNRKKQERKKYVLKEGSRYEDLALIIALNEVASSSDKLQEECRDLLRALVLCGLDQEAKSLQHQFAALLDIIEKDIPNVWPPVTAESSLIQNSDSHLHFRETFAGNYRC